MSRLRILCGQEYGAEGMSVVPCERGRCGNWDPKAVRCTVLTGAEHFPLVPVPEPCPIQDRCQHEIQSRPNPCAVRARGMVCNSVLKDLDDPRSFDVYFSADAEDYAAQMRNNGDEITT